MNGSDKIHLGDTTELPIKGKSKVRILKFINSVWIEGLITNVLYMPGLKRNLFSEGIVTNKNMRIIKTVNGAEIYNCDNSLVASAVCTSNNLYQMLFKTMQPIEANAATTSSIKI